MDKCYYAIIPANIRYDKTLNANAKLLYGEITALANEKGYCWASNKYFAELYGVSKETISRWINSLEKKGYVKFELVYQEGTKNIIERRIYIHGVPIDKNEGRYRQKDQEPIDENVKTPIDKNVKDNNTVFNNTFNIKYNRFFETYNKQNIIIHKTLTSKMKQAINRSLKKDDEDTIIKAIERYGQAFRDKNYQFCNYKMTLDKFLTQSNGYTDWLEEGQKWINYTDFKNKPVHTDNDSRKRSSPQSKIKTKFHLEKSRGDKYSAEELEALILNKQKKRLDKTKK